METRKLNVNKKLIRTLTGDQLADVYGAGNDQASLLTSTINITWACPSMDGACYSQDPYCAGETMQGCHTYDTCDAICA